ncbi:MAG: NAD(P)-dependent alcohol dehydrogenase [Syntrophaceae bacterium]|nr:NAD(P)-dependent alcohol dehydrogenase [Syntrophaceae bacterium]
MLSRHDTAAVPIRAAVLRRRGGPLTLEALEMEGPREDEVLVRIVATGICHTDIRYVDDWHEDADGPLVLGHEGAGVVERVGDGVKGFQRGDHVVLSYQSCGHCEACSREHPADCESLADLNFGFHRADGSNALRRSGVRGHFFGQSSFSTHALATERNLVKVPKTLPLEILAPLGCGMQTGAGTVMNSLKVPAGASIAVFGTGAVGLAAVMAARIAGAHPIIGVDRVPARLKLARELGATDVIDTRREGVTDRIRAITGSGVDYVVETSGNQRLYRLAVVLLNPGGTAAYLAGVEGPDPLPGGRRALSVIQGDAVPQVFIPKLIDLHLKRLFPFERLQRHYEFRQINRAIADARCGRTVKPVLVFGAP